MTPDIQGLEVKQWANSSTTLLTWNKNAINASHINIDIYQFDDVEYRLKQDALATFKHVPNTGSYQLDFSEKNIAANRRYK